MNDQHRFHAAMAELLRFMGIAPQAGPANEGYELQFNDGGKIYFAQIEPGSIDAIAEAGTLGSLDAASVLLDLLELNQAAAGHPLIAVSVERASRRVFVRARIALANAARDELANLTWSVIGRLAATRNRLGNPGAQGKPAVATVRTGSLDRLRARFIK